jgi:exopolysaccharide biosynthesis polyprenyl glycosylphosphotransferase
MALRPALSEPSVAHLSAPGQVLPLRGGAAAAPTGPVPAADGGHRVRFREAQRLGQLLRVAPLVLDAAAMTASLLALGVAGGRHGVPVVPALAVAWLLLMRTLGGYERGIGSSLAAEAKSVAFAGFTGVLAIVQLGPLAGVHTSLSAPRGLALAVILLLLGRMALRTLERTVRQKPALRRRVLVVGDGPDARELLANLDAWPGLDLDVVGVCANTTETTVGDLPVLGLTRSCALVARQLGVDTVLLAPGSLAAEDVSKLQTLLLDAGVEVLLVPHMGQAGAGRLSVRQLGGLPLLHVGRRESGLGLLGKRALDLAVAVPLVMLLAPLFALLAVLIRVDSPGPAFFRQRRVGKGGAAFTLWKFRTMATDAEARLDALRAAGAGGDGLFKLADDPRVTRVGRWLRRTSLDELPQLINVLRGEMSLVGPRPALPREVAEFDDFTLRRLRVTPGITGLWQVSGRSDTSFATYSRLDAYYAENRTLAGDLAILGRTLPAVLRSKGAY